jgi:nitrate reductase gamma subunit
MGVQMFKLFSSAMLLTVSVVRDTFANAVAVPAPEIGGGMVGIMLATGVVYLINRRRSRS